MLSSGPWLQPNGPDCDVVASSRVRLARNVAGLPFSNRASVAQRLQILALLQRVEFPPELTRGVVWVNLNQATPRERQLLVERHLISRQLAEGDLPRAVAIAEDESVSVMVNEEDHVRLQVVLPGLQLASALERADRIDDAIEASVDFAFNRRYGYLTACPTNVGCGMRLSVMMHLPALRITNEIERVKRAAKELNLVVRGFYGEGSDATGDFFQVSNQTTLGLAERELLEKFQGEVVPLLVSYERHAREVLARQGSVLDDRLHRAVGILRAARLLGTDEAMKLLSRVRLGIHMGRIADVAIDVVNRLLLQVQPAHLQTGLGPAAAAREISGEELREARATLVRTAMAPASST